MLVRRVHLYICNFLDCNHVVCLYQKSVCKVYRTCLQSNAIDFLMPDQRHFHSLYSYSMDKIDRINCTIKICRYILTYGIRELVKVMFYWGRIIRKLICLFNHLTQKRHNSVYSYFFWFILMIIFFFRKIEMLKKWWMMLLSEF